MNEYEEKKVWEIRITADSNDADYVTVIHEITQEHLDKIMPLMEAIKAFNEESRAERRAKQKDSSYQLKYDWNQSNYDVTDSRRDYLSPKDLYPDVPEEAFDWFDDITPWCGDFGFHTIESVTICPIPNVIQLV